MTSSLTTTVAIAGGGPAAIMCGYLLARAGINVIVLEKHNDFLRDFRGDTIHPSTFEIMHELGILNDFLKLPHQEMKELTAQFNDETVTIADFSHIKAAKPVLAFMPQWHFLNFIKSKAEEYPSFRIMMNAKVIDLIKVQNRIAGVVVETAEGMLEVNADLVIGADGRGSVVREKAGLKVISSPASIDVLWFRLAVHHPVPEQSFGRFFYGKMLVQIFRGDYYQCAYVIGKGRFEEIKARGLDAFKSELQQLVPYLSDAVEEITTWQQISMLNVKVDHLEKWYKDGLLCIGDAAHAMSPVGGVGINLALQDAVATSNILYPYLKENKLTIAALKKVQQRRSFTARMVQRMQVGVHKNLIEKQLSSAKGIRPPFFFRLLNRFPYLRRLPAMVVGMGIRREHVRTPEV